MNNVVLLYSNGSKHADRMAKSGDPDQSAASDYSFRSSLIWVDTDCSDLLQEQSDLCQH